MCPGWRPLLIVVLLVCASTVRAQRVEVPPLLQQFDTGHGLALATLTEIDPAPQPDNRTRLVFRIDEVVAKPLVDGPWVQDRSPLTLHANVGFNTTFERWQPARGEDPLGGQPPVGTRYLLSVRWDKAKETFEHATGAGAAEHLAELPQERRALIGEVRELAATQGPARAKRCRELVVDGNARLALRLEAIRHLRDRGTHAQPPANDVEAGDREAERKAAAESLRQVWLSAELVQSPELIRAVDRALLRIDSGAFDRSAERRDVWIAHIFRPMIEPGPRREQFNELTQRPMPILMTIGTIDPPPVTEVLMKQLADPRWPLDFRMNIASCLAQIDDWVKVRDPRWEEAWRAFVNNALPTAEAHHSTLLLTTIGRRLGADPNARPKRPLAITNELVDLLNAKRNALATLQEQEPDRYGPPLQKCEALIAWIREQ